MTKIAFTRESGSVSINYPVSKEIMETWRGKLTDEEYEKILSDKLVRTYPQYDLVEIEDSAIPADDEFRNAWKLDGVIINYNLDKAKAIQLSRIRAARKPKLAELDREYMIEDEKGVDGDKPTVTAKKKLLRDITRPLIALVPTNIQGIRDAFPEILRND